MSNTPKLVAVGGAARSGTTLLTRVLNSHPEVVVTAEFANFAHLGKTPARHVANVQKRWWSNPLLPVPRHNFGSNNKTYNLLFILEYMARLVPFWRTPVDADIIQKVLRDIFPDCSVIGDKLPNYIIKLDELTQIENMYPIMIYRDPRDVVRSWLGRIESGAWSPPWPHESPEEVVDAFGPFWMKGIDAMEAHAGSILIVCYEEFVTSPLVVVEKLGSWLDISPNQFNCEGIHARSVGKYKNELDAYLVESMEKIAGSAMERLGYL